MKKKKTDPFHYPFHTFVAVCGFLPKKDMKKTDSFPSVMSVRIEGKTILNPKVENY